MHGLTIVDKNISLVFSLLPRSEISLESLVTCTPLLSSSLFIFFLGRPCYFNVRNSKELDCEIVSISPKNLVCI